MSAMMFSYVRARQLEIELDVERRRRVTAPSMRDRLCRTLIGLGEQLVALPPKTLESRNLESRPSGARRSVRSAA